VIFGGADASNYLSDTWALAFDGGPHWQLLASSGPGARTLPTSIYDSAAGGMWMFGGVLGNGSGYQDLWFLSLGVSPSWTLKTPSGTLPSPRWGSGSFLDPVDGRMVVFGGVDLVDWLDQTWALPLAPGSSWSQLHPGLPVEPPVRLAASIFMDIPHDQLLLFGGTYDDISGSSDTWSLSLSDPTFWTPVNAGGPSPPGRFSHASVFDSKRNRELIYGGYGGGFLHDLWALDLSGPASWSKLNDFGVPLDALGAVYDPVGDRMVIFGGSDGASRHNEVWWFPLDDPAPFWHLQSTTGPTIPPRSGFGCAYDPTRQAMWVIGGEVQDNTGSIDVWRLSLATMEWTPVATFGTPPSPRWGLSLVYDSGFDRLLLFGGVDLVQWHNDVWQLSLSGTPSWAMLTPNGTPPAPRVWSGVTIDPTRQRLIVDGGNSSFVFGDTWALEIDKPVPAAPSWIASEPITGGIRVSWYAPQGGAAEVQRRTEATDWETLGWESADGSQRIVFDDRTVVAGARYDYRIRMGDTPYGETWVTISAGQLALAGFSTNPAGARPSISFRLAKSAPARIEVIDLKGRLVYRREVGGMGPGDHTVTAEGLTPGVYWLQLRQENEIRRVKGIVLH